MLYSFLKIFVRLFRPLFFRSIRVNRPELLQQKGPLLIASNHPNSFLDAVLLDTLFEQPIWSLARGDVFKNKFLTRLLTAIKILPVYRVSEGVENLSTNYETFDECKKLFRQNGLVLIFSEGICVNEWHLRPLKKGTARLAISSWKENIPLSILPVGINYSSFTRFGKDVVINIGDPIIQKDIPCNGTEGQNIQSFNELLTRRLQPLVYEISPDDEAKREKLVYSKPSSLKKAILAVPAFFGWVLHQPLFAPLRFFAVKKAFHTGHYDSVLAILLFLSYPLYLVLISLILFTWGNHPALAGLAALLPFTAFCYIRYRDPAK